MRLRTNSASPEASAASNPERSPFLMDWHRGAKKDSRRGYGASKAFVGTVWVVKRWHGIRYVRSSLPILSMVETWWREWTGHTRGFCGSPGDTPLVLL